MNESAVSPRTRSEGMLAMNLAQWLLRSAARSPQAPALFLGTHCVSSYGQWADRVARMAGALKARGLRPGDRVALFMGNGPAYLEVLYAIWWAGMAAVPMNAKLHAREAAWMIGDAGAALCFVDTAHGSVLAEVLGQKLEEIPDEAAGCALVDVGSAAYSALCATAAAHCADVEGDALAWLFYTSGTTGRPKGAMLSHRNLQAMALCYFSDVDTVSSHDAIVYAAPASHGAGLYNFMHVLRGARHVMPESGGFEPAEIITLAAFHRNVSMFAAPTMVKRLVDYVEASAADCSGIRTIVYGGGPMYAQDILRALRVMGPRFVQIYGQGESPMTITALCREVLVDSEHPDYLRRIGSVGVAQACVQVRVADSEGTDLPHGEVGEILVRGDTVMRGYWRNPAASAKALRDGWLWTGDMGSLDACGYLSLVDRSKDVIITGGSNVYPREVEEILLLHPAVDEVSVIGVPDSEWGEVVLAVVALRPAALQDPLNLAQALDALCLQHVARFKRPKRYEFVAALQKNAYGKVLKTALRERYAGAAEGQATPSK